MSSSSISCATNIYDFKKLANKVEETTLTTDKSSSLKKGIKALRTGKQEANFIITGHESVDPDLARVQDIIVYDIPVVWMTQSTIRSTLDYSPRRYTCTIVFRKLDTEGTQKA